MQSIPRILTCVALMMFSVVLPAQNGNNNNWYFGNNAGITFNSVPPAVLGGSQLTTIEGCAAISDASGNLLFYTDGTVIWDANHNVMPNATGLFGNASCSQSAVIVPDPDNCDRFYVFTPESCTGGSNGGDPTVLEFAYTVVDMTLNGGLGDIVVGTKNTVLFGPTAEKCTALRHANGTDIWVIGHDYPGTTFYAYPLSASGVGAAVTSNVGTNHANCAGYLQGSPNNDKIVSAVTSGASDLEVYDFNPATGVISNPQVLLSGSLAYGVAFSASGQYVYVGDPIRDTIYQFDLFAANPAATKYVVATNTRTGALSMGPDGRIYCTSIGNTYLHVIADPEQPGAACNFISADVSLGTKTSTYGLPNQVDVLLYSVDLPDFTWTLPCFGDTVEFEQTGGNNWSWNFDDPASGTNTSKLQNPKHLFSGPGDYDVSVITEGNCASGDTVVQTVSVSALQAGISSDKDSGICEGEIATLTALPAGAAYAWSTGHTTDIIQVDSPGFYSVTVTDVLGCKGIDTFELIKNSSPVPTADAGPDRLVVCLGNGVGIGGNPAATGGTPPYVYRWDPPADLSSHLVANPMANPPVDRDYVLVVQDSKGCVGADIVHVTVADAPIVDAGADTEACEDQPVVLGGAPTAKAGSPPYSYSWSPHQLLNQSILSNPTALLQQDRQFIVMVTDSNGCVAFDTVDITIVAPPVADAGMDRSICPGASTPIGGNPTASGLRPPFAIQWSPAAGLSNTTVANPVSSSGSAMTYLVTITDQLGCIGRDTMDLIIHAAPSAGFTSAVTGMTAHLTDISSNAVAWHWDFGDGHTDVVQHPSHSYFNSGTYQVCLNVTSSAGCEDIICDSLTIAGETSTTLEFESISLAIFPNPAGDIMNIRFGQAIDHDLDMIILSAHGQTLYQQKLPAGTTQSPIAVETLPRGVHMLQLRSADAEMLIPITLR